MADGGFVSADIGKISKFMSESAEAIHEFDAIKEKFNSINSTLLSKWKGEGAEAYKRETDHILENTRLDNELAEYNRNPPSGDGNGG